jgi:hypothetical protein
MGVADNAGASIYLINLFTLLKLTRDFTHVINEVRASVCSLVSMRHFDDDKGDSPDPEPLALCRGTKKHLKRVGRYCWTDQVKVGCSKARSL